MRIAKLWIDGAAAGPVLVADTFAGRLRGMLGRRVLPPALLLRPANSVHGMGMRVPLDVAVLDEDGVVLRVQVLRPFGFTRTVHGGRQVLEAPTGSFSAWSLAPGARVTATSP